jgi:aminomethyltransferase
LQVWGERDSSRICVWTPPKAQLPEPLRHTYLDCIASLESAWFEFQTHATEGAHEIAGCGLWLLTPRDFRNLSGIKDRGDLASFSSIILSRSFSGSFILLLRTPLYETHQRIGAKLVDFGGWEMPLHYGSQVDEHHAVRKHAGMFDVSHMCTVEVVGAQAKDFLHFALANNVSKLKTHGRALYSCMLNERGGVVDDLIVYYFDDTTFRLVVNAGTAQKDIAWLNAIIAREKFAVALTPRKDVAMIAVQGPAAREAVWKVLENSRAATADLKPFNSATVDDIFIARTGYTGEDGFEIILPATRAAEFWTQLQSAGVKPCGLGARDTLRLEAGMNLYGQDMNDDTTPLESNLAWTVDMSTDRKFIGRAALEAAPVRQLVGLVPLGAGILRSHQVVQTLNGKSMGNGEITSGSFSPTLNISIAFARIPVGVAIGDTVQAEVRGKWLDCRVTKFPFVRNGQSLI